MFLSKMINRLIFAAILASVFGKNYKNFLGKILNGDLAKPNQFPFQVLLKCFKIFEVIACGGSIVSESYILTAGHCTSK